MAKQGSVLVVIGDSHMQGYVETSLGKFWTEKDSFKVYSTLATA